MLHWLEAFRDAADGPAPGTIVTPDDLDRLQPFLLPGFIDEFRFPGATLEIEAPYRFTPPAIYEAATRANGDRTTLGPDGELVDYTAGLPFSRERIEAASPEDAGLMIAWNHIHRWQHYGYHIDEMQLSLIRPSATGERSALSAGLVGGGTVDRFMAMFYHRVYLSHGRDAAGQRLSRRRGRCGSNSLEGVHRAA